MHPSNPTRVAPRVTVLPEATREEMLAACGLSGGNHWHEVDRVPRRTDDAADVDTYGLDGWDDPVSAERELEELGFILDSGWHAVDPVKGTTRGEGTTSHRGVLHPHEYVDAAALQGLIESELGFTFEQVRSVYKQGPKTGDQRELRDRIDGRLLALSRAGGEMTLLGAAFGFKVDRERPKGDSSCRTMERAIERAVAAEQAQVAA